MRLHRLSTFLNGIAPSSALTCWIEGDPAPEGGNPSPAANPPAPAPPASNPFTPEQLAYIESEKAKARDAGAAATRRALEGRPARPPGETPQPPRNDNPPPAPQSQTVDVRAEMARVRAFERAANRYGLTDAALSILEDDFNRANPTDPASWVSQRADAFGWKPGAHAQTVNPAGNGSPPGGSGPAPLAAAPPPSMPGSAPPSRVVTADTRIVDMSPADRDALADRVGEKAFRDRLRTELKADPRRVPLR